VGLHLALNERPQAVPNKLQRFADAFTGAAAPPPAASYIDSTRATLALAHSLRTGEPVAVS